MIAALVALLVTAVVFAFDVLILRPTGIYVYHDGWSPFDAGINKSQAFQALQGMKGVVQIRTGFNVSMQDLIPPERFVFDESLIRSDNWAIHGYRKGTILLVFKDEKLDLVLLHRRRFGELNTQSSLMYPKKDLSPGEVLDYLGGQDYVRVFDRGGAI